MEKKKKLSYQKGEMLLVYCLKWVYNKCSWLLFVSNRSQKCKTFLWNRYSQFSSIYLQQATLVKTELWKGYFLVYQVVVVPAYLPKKKIRLKNVSPSDAFSFDDLECEAYHKVELKTGRPLYQRAKNYF